MSPINRIMKQDRTLLAAVIVGLTLLNVFSTLRGTSAQFASHHSTDKEWPIEGLRVAALTPEESVHYRIETDIGAAEWESTLPRGNGVVFHQTSSSEVKPYRLSMFHQLSCLATLRTALAKSTTPPSAETHFCLNYMRESLTCGADAHLEMVRSEYGGRAVLPYTTRTDCVDWEHVWEAAEANFDGWAQGR